MKQCPTCRTTYTDDSLRFCLADGANLVSIPDDDSTLVSPKFEPVRAEAASGRRSVSPDAAEPPSTKKIVLVIGSAVILFVGAVVVAGALLYFNRDTRRANAVTQPTPTSTPAPTPDGERQKLEDQLANIQRQLDEQKAENKSTDTDATPVPPTPPDTTGFVSARVNSPNDGFLALRDKPHAEFGNRVEKIPHGATVTIENCGPLQRRLGGRLGRWCMITYNGKTGYAFDAFLERQ